MSFFDQDQAILEIEFSKTLVQQWRHRVSKGEKLAAKLEFRNNIVELHIVDEKDNVFKLSGFNLKSETNLMIQGVDPIGILQYKCKGISEDLQQINSLSEQLKTIGKDTKQIEEDDEKADHIFVKHTLQLLHKQSEKGTEGYRQLDNYDRDNIQRDLIKFLNHHQEGVTIQFLQSQPKFRYSKVRVFFLNCQDDLQKKLLNEITDKRKVQKETRYILRKEFVRER